MPITMSHNLLAQLAQKLAKVYTLSFLDIKNLNLPQREQEKLIFCEENGIFNTSTTMLHHAYRSPCLYQLAIAKDILLYGLVTRQRHLSLLFIGEMKSTFANYELESKKNIFQRCV